jgi:hypothetical protein
MGKERKYAFIFMLVVMLMAVCINDVAADSYQSNLPVNLQFTCTVGQQIPSATATYNISIYYPNGTVFVNNEDTTSQGQGSFNYTTTFPTYGDYKIKSFCYDGANGNFSSSDILNVSRMGDTLDTGKSIIYLLFMIAVLTVLGLCVWGTITIPYSNHSDEDGNVFSVNNLKYVKIFLGAMSYAMLILFFGLTRSILDNYVPNSGIAGFFDVGYWLTLNGLFVAIPCIFVWLIMLFWDDKKINKMLDRGFTA